MFTPDQITTDRLILRRFKEEDLNDVFALMSDDYICKMAGIPIFKTLERAKRFMDNWEEDAYAITEKGCDKVIGIIQISSLWWRREAHLGYWLSEEYRGKGYMTEVVKAVCEVTFAEWWCEEIRIYVYVGNEASKNVALKCGFYPKDESYKDMVYSHYGTVESEECFIKTAGDYEWELRGKSFYTTAAAKEAA
jgi:ribosomal-protein-alanine N-acetyltransferase